MNRILFASAPVLLALIVACSSDAPTAPPPTSTPIVYPATFTPVAPTEIPVTPTETGIPPTRTPDAETQKVIAALARTSRLTVYRARMSMSLRDPSGSLPGSKPNEPFTLMNMEGRVNQTDSQWKISGFFILFLGGDVDKGIEFLTLGDLMYLHGPVPFLGANEDRWYVASKGSSNFTTNSDPNSMLKELATGGAFPSMRVVTNESLDGRGCTKYLADENETLRLFAGLEQNPQFAQGASGIQGTLQRASMNVWVCDDNYVHQIEMVMEVAEKDNPDQIGTVSLSIHLDDLNVVVPLTAPSDVAPLPNPFQFPTPGSNPIIVPTTTSLN